MQRLSDGELLDELKQRFEEKKKSLSTLKELMQSLEKVNNKLQESEAVKSNFLSNIRNEINNPLAAIMGLAKNLFSVKKPENETTQAVSRTIYAEAFNLDYQLKNIFTAAELEAGETDLALSNVDIIHLLKHTIESFRHLLKKKSIEVDLINQLNELPTGSLFFKTDADKVKLIIANLLSNAIEFSSEGSRLEIRFQIEASELKISIQDFGIGIEQSVLSKIFDRFKQLDSGTTKKHKGHGLGLSIVKATLDILNGEISVSSESEKGSVFTISIPEPAFSENVDSVTLDDNELFFENAELF